MNIENPPELLHYLRSTGRISPDESPPVRVLAGGVSNRTVWVQRADGGWVLKQALEKLRVAVDWYSPPQRVHREALGLRWLGELAPPGSLPGFVFEDFEQHILAMTAVPQPHENWKEILLAGGLETGHVAQFGRLLAAIHANAHARAQELAPAFADRAFFESLRLEPYYAYTADAVPQAAAFLRQLIDQTRSHSHTLVHGDYSPKNVLVHAGRLVLLDYEVIHWGDPAFDVGFALTHLLSKAHHIPGQRGAFVAAAVQFWRAYADGLGPVPWQNGLAQRAVGHTLACLLARVAGRSPLEYLDRAARARQQGIVCRLLHAPPSSVPALAEIFGEQLDAEQNR